MLRCESAGICSYTDREERVFFLLNSHFHLWMSHVTHAWVASHKYESCHTGMSHATHAWVMSHMPVMSHVNESCHTRMSHVTRVWVMSHMNGSCHTCMSHVTHEWVVSRMNSSRVEPNLNDFKYLEACHTWMSHVTREWVISHMNESRYLISINLMTPVYIDRRNHGTHKGIISHAKESCHTWVSHWN